MGQKVNPHGLRVGIIKEWDSVWFSEENYAKYLVEDYRIREHIKNKQFIQGAPSTASSISKITIHRTNTRCKVGIFTAKPGIVIGRGGSSIQELTKELGKLTDQRVLVNVEEIKLAEKDAQLVAEDIARQMENRIAYRRAMKQAMTKAMRLGILGIKTQVSGRLNGTDIARTEHYHEGTIPLQTLRADIDYGFAEAYATYGKLGVKVWIYHGEVLPAVKGENKEKDIKK